MVVALEISPSRFVDSDIKPSLNTAPSLAFLVKVYFKFATREGIKGSLRMACTPDNNGIQFCMGTSPEVASSRV